MSITNDIRGYADTAIEQGKQVVTQAVGQAQANVAQLTTRAGGAVTDLRSQAEKTLNVDAIRAAVEPYLAQAKIYRSGVTERAEGLLGSVKESVTSDKRVARVVSTAESVTGLVVDTVTERVVKPVTSLTGRKPVTSTRPTTTTSAASSNSTAAKAPAKKAAKPAATRPAAKKTAAKSTTKSTTKSAAKKAPAKKTTASSS